jgi:predicted extracellular nuclease
MKLFRFVRISAIAALILLYSRDLPAQQERNKYFYVAGWNLENLFDTIKDPVKKDDEFLPGSEKRWNDARLDQKLDHLVYVINYMNQGCGPDVLGIEEVENINVVKRLIYKMTGRDYIIVHRDSPDERGIDVGLIYDRRVFDIDSVASLHVELPDHKPTRDILHVVLVYRNTGEKIHFYVNHWPSRRGGELDSEKNRMAAANVLRSSLDTLNRTAPGSNVVILGDFNDGPENNSLAGIAGINDFDCNSGAFPNQKFINITLKKYRAGDGTYSFKGKYEMIDQILLSSSLLGNGRIRYECESFDVIKPELMRYREGKNAGNPIPTYIGNRYIGGYSDHFPVGAKFIVKELK